MIPNEAYELVCKFLKEKRAVAMCRNYDDYFGFFMLPPGSKKGDRVFVGREMILVDKKTRKVFWQDDNENLDLRGKFWRPVSDKDLGLDALAHSYLG